MPRKPFAVRLLHWMVAGLFVVAVPTGYRLADTGWSGIGLLDRRMIYGLHQYGGALIAILLLAWALLRGRDAWRSTTRPGWWDGSVIASHILFAGMATGIAVLGWVGGSAAAGARTGFDIIAIPGLLFSLSAKQVVSIYALHKALIPYFLVLLAVHVGAVAFHVLVLKDTLLVSMLFSGRQKNDHESRY